MGESSSEVQAFQRAQSSVLLHMESSWRPFSGRSYVTNCSVPSFFTVTPSGSSEPRSFVTANPSISPLSMKRHPETGELWAIWNDYAPQRAVHFDPWHGGMGRTPLVLARSCDEGATWSDHVVLESDPCHGYSYVAMFFLGGSRLLLEYCCGGKADCGIMLQDSCVRIVELPAKAGGEK